MIAAVLQAGNLYKAVQQVVRNKGASGRGYVGLKSNPLYTGKPRSNKLFYLQ